MEWMPFQAVSGLLAGTALSQSKLVFLTGTRPTRTYWMFPSRFRETHVVELLAEAGGLGVRRLACERDAFVVIRLREQRAKFGDAGRTGDGLAVLDWNGDHFEPGGLPASVAGFVLQAVGGVEFELINVGGVGSAGGGGPSDVAIVAEREHGRADEEESLHLQVVAEDMRLVEHGEAFPGKVRVGEEDGDAVRGTFGRDRPRIRTKVLRIARILEFILDLAEGPAHDHRLADGDRVPRFEAERPFWTFLGVRGFVRFHALDERDEHLAGGFRAGVERELGAVGILDQTHRVVRVDVSVAGTERGGHQADCSTYVRIEIAEAVFGHGVAHAVGRVAIGSAKNVGDAVLVAMNHDLTGGRAVGKR